MLHTGLTVDCVGCGQRLRLFDAARDGYYGENGHCEWLNIPTKASPLVDEHDRPVANVRIQTVYIYNIEMDELEAIATELNVKPQDLFDSFVLEAEMGIQWPIVWQWECA